MHTAPREIVRKYEVLDELGAGGMGVTFKVRHRHLDTIQVVKVMRPGLAANEEMQGRFMREARFASGLAHPSIAKVHDFDIVDSGLAYLVMEYIEGISLEDLMDKLDGPLEIELAVEIAMQSLSALHHMHEAGIVHRDISPDNILLTTERQAAPRVKLIDMGIAKSLEAEISVTQSGLFLGKPHYASPEQFEGVTIDARSDLYSFGIVFYQMLTNAFPIQGEDNMSLMMGHVIHPPVPFEESDPEGRVPQALREAVLKSLEKKADQRYASGQEFFEALEALDLPRVRKLDDEILALVHAPKPETAPETAAPAPAAAEPEVEPAEPTQSTERPATSGAIAQLSSFLDRAEQLLNIEQADAAKMLLDTVLESDPTNERAQALIKRHPGLQELYGDQVRADADAIFAELAEDRSAGRLDDALAKMQRVLELVPDDEELLQYAEDLEREKAEREVKAQERAAIQELNRRVDELLADNDVEQALAAITEAEARFPDAGGLRALRLRTQRKAARVEQQHLRESVARARSRIQKGDPEAAIPALEEVLASDPENEVATLLLEQARQALRDREEQKRLGLLVDLAEQQLADHELDAAESTIADLAESPAGAQAVARLRPRLEAARIEAALMARESRVMDLIEADDLESAATELDSLAKDAPERAGVAELGRTLEEARQARLERETAERLDQLQQAAHEQIASGEIGQAKSTLAEMRSLAGDDDPRIVALDERLASRIAELERRAADERIQTAISQTTHEVEGLLSKGDLDQAEAALSAAEAELGSDAASLGQLRDRIEETRAARDAEVQKLASETLALVAAGSLEGAEASLAGLVERYPDRPEVTEIRERLAEARTARQRVDEAAREIEELASSGSLEDAEVCLEAAIAEFGQDEPTLAALRSKLSEMASAPDASETADEPAWMKTVVLKPGEMPDLRAAMPPPEQLVAAVGAFLAGDYDRVAGTLSDVSLQDPRAQLQVALLRGAASFNAYRSSLEPVQQLLDAARDAVHECKGIDPQFAPDPRVFSPAFLDFFRDAGGPS